MLDEHLKNLSNENPAFKQQIWHKLTKGPAVYLQVLQGQRPHKDASNQAVAESGLQKA